MTFVIRAGREKERVRSSRSAPVAKAQSPEAINNDWSLVDPLEQTIELAVRFEAHDGAAAEIPDQQLIPVSPKTAGCDRQTPRRIDSPEASTGIGTRGKTPEIAGLRIKCVNQPMSRPGHIILFGFILLSKSHKDNATE